ncbi:hypothetical protein JDV02_005610 [Purpureocillium takamizusanense]|uniref:Uncharacterized protein n=1 Tax=Purpureocillium takamizusanense TaxID=2060973 RepID=A0A9Q8QIE7_9HYPO|nr:uncharacterized protein JDV02_005610 [Purpureocillium takamizusanense]UNI19426.1 hypothetical protein JDV02_005610 [Purpureocillium takamizusanense]
MCRLGLYPMYFVLRPASFGAWHCLDVQPRQPQDLTTGKQDTLLSRATSFTQRPPRLSNFLAVVLMLLGLVAAQQTTSVRSTATPSVTSSSAASNKSTGTTSSAAGKSVAANTASGTGTAAKSSASASATTTKKSAGNRAAGAGADSTLITVSLAAGLVVFGVAMS